MSEFDGLPETIDRVVKLAEGASGNQLKTVKTATALPTGRTAIILNDGTFTEVGDAIADHYGLKITPPGRIKRNLVIQTVDSLVDYIDKFRTGGTVLFADIKASKIVAVLDYDVDADTTAHGSHIAALQLPFADEWTLWSGIDDKLLGQLPFARFLEENSPDIKAPSGSELIEACRDLQAKRSVNFIAAVRTSTNNESFEYSDATDARGKDGVEIPTKFILEIPFYFGSRAVELAAFLRWQVDDGKLALGIKLNRAEQVRQALFKEIVLDLGERAGVPVIYGPYNIP